MRRIASSIAVMLWLAVWGAGGALALNQQAPIANVPGAPLTMAGLATYLNLAYVSIGSCNAGPSAPLNGPSSAAFPGECWWNTSSSVWVLSVTWDGTHWSEVGTLNTAASPYVWTPYLGGNPSAATAPLVSSVSGGVLDLALQYDSNFTNNGSNQLSLTPVASGHLLANGTAGSAEPTDTSPTTWLDRWCSSVQYNFPQAGASTWGCNTISNLLVQGTGMSLSGTGQVTIALANQIAASGPTGGAATIPIITYNAQGQLTAVSTAVSNPTQVNGNSWPSSGASGGIPYFSSTTAISSTALLTQWGVIYGGGLGAAPASTAAGTNDQVFMGATNAAPSWVSVNNCSGALTYSTSTHAFGCNSGAGTGTVTEQKNTASGGLTTTGNCDNTTTNASSPCNYALSSSRQTNPTTQTITTAGANQSITPPAGALWAEFKIRGSGGGGGGGGSGGGTGSAGSDACLNTSSPACTSPLYDAGGGAAAGSSGGSGGAGGAISGSQTCVDGANGGIGSGYGAAGSASPGGIGGPAYEVGIPGWGGAPGGNGAAAPPANSGAGGGGGTTTASLIGNGGGGGAQCYGILSSLAAQYYVTVPSGGSGGAAGSSGGAGATGGSGFAEFIWHYNFLLRRDLDPASNDNLPAFVAAAA